LSACKKKCIKGDTNGGTDMPHKDHRHRFGAFRRLHFLPLCLCAAALLDNKCKMETLCRSAPEVMEGRIFTTRVSGKDKIPLVTLDAAEKMRGCYLKKAICFGDK
ncbi:hypothetical protein CEXT_386751, partial [Caerostris extrusa]